MIRALGEELERDDRVLLIGEDVGAAVDYAVAALEIVDSRIADWDIAITDTIADNASSAMFVLSERRLLLSEFSPREVPMQMYVDGAFQKLKPGTEPARTTETA